MAMCELVILVQSRAILCDIFLYFFVSDDLLTD